MFQTILLFLFSFILVSLGQPTWGVSFAAITACCGYALFWQALLSLPQSISKLFGKRTIIVVATAWFSGIQFFQLFWFVSHPYIYIYLLYAVLSLGMGVQFGVLSSLITKERLESRWRALGLAGLWTIFEWLRLYFIIGFVFNPAGMALSGNDFSRQLTALFGVYGLSFFVILTNLYCLRIIQGYRKSLDITICIVLVVFPYVFGFVHLQYHEKKASSSFSKESTLSSILVQTNTPVELPENLSSNEIIVSSYREWKAILGFLKPYYKGQNKNQMNKDKDLINFILMPEIVVIFEKNIYLFPYELIKKLFVSEFGVAIQSKLPPLEESYAKNFSTDLGKKWFVNHCFIAQSIANIFASDVIVGLESKGFDSYDVTKMYNAAIVFQANSNKQQFYAKQVLLPMGEYIPYEWCKEIAKKYGVTGSFALGEQTKVFKNKETTYGISICYEELFSHLIRRVKQKKGELLLNLSNDGWFPNSSLAEQHFEHARLRTLENGVSLLRAVNNGITAGVNSLGQTVRRVENRKQEGALLVELPNYHYWTLYSAVGNLGILIISLLFLGFDFFSSVTSDKIKPSKREDSKSQDNKEK